MSEKSWFRLALQWIDRVENAFDYDPVAAAHKRIDRLEEEVRRLAGTASTEISGLNIVTKPTNPTQDGPIRGADQVVP